MGDGRNEVIQVVPERLMQLEVGLVAVHGGGTRVQRLDELLDSVVARRTQYGGVTLDILYSPSPHEACPLRAHVQRLQIRLMPGVMPATVLEVVFLIHLSLLSLG
jgi:hypothetical protein